MALVSQHTGTGNIVAGSASMYATGSGTTGAATAAAAAAAAAAAVALAKESRHSTAATATATTALNSKSITAKLLHNSYQNGHLSQVIFS